MIKLPISKYHSVASDYVVLDLRVQSPTVSLKDMPRLAVELCRRKGIVGADGVACILSSDDLSAEVHIFNPDGGESELCINGLRCAARKLLDEKTSDRIELRNAFTVVAASRRAALAENLPAIGITVPQPILRLSPPFLVDGATVSVGDSIVIEGQHFNGASLYIPHLIAISKRFHESVLTQLGQRLQKDHHFPSGINVSYLAPLEQSSFFMSTFERGGAGLTRSCSSALICGAAILWNDESITLPRMLSAFSDGGVSTILREEGLSITATANATHVYDATLDIDPSTHKIKPLFAGSANMDEIDAYDDWLTSLRIADLKAFVEA